MSKKFFLYMSIFLFILGCSKSSEQGEYVIGSLIPITGPAAEFGEYNKMASDLFVELYNSDPANKVKIRHLVEDSKSSGKESVNAINAMLLKDKPIAILNELSSASLSVAPITDKEKIIQIAIAGNPMLTTSYEYTFRNYPDATRLARETIKAFFRENKERKFAIFYINDEFGLGVKDVFSDELKGLGGKLVAEDAFDKGGKDFRSQLTKLINAKPEAVYLIGYGKALGISIKQIRELGYKGKLVGGPEAAFSDVLSIANKAANGLLYMNIGYDPKSDRQKTQYFIEKYRKKYGKEPTLVSVIVFDAWDMLMHAIKNAGNTEPDSIKNELIKIDNFDGVVAKLSISEGRDIIHPLVINRINVN